MMNSRCLSLLFSTFLIASSIVVHAQSPETTPGTSDQQTQDKVSSTGVPVDKATLWSTLANEQPAQLQFDDDFKENRLQQFQTDGDVKWTEGAIKLKSGSTLTGPVATGPVANVEFTLEKPSSDVNDNAETWFGVVMATGWRAGVSVGPVMNEMPADNQPGTIQSDARQTFELRITTTMIDPDSKKPVTTIVRKSQIDASPIGKWLVRYNHGVVEAWHNGVRLLSGDCGYGDIGLSGVEVSQRHQDTQLVHLRLAARDPIAGPEFDDLNERQKLIDEWGEIAPKASELLRQRKIQEYLPIVQRQAILEEQIFGAMSLIPIKTGAQVGLALELTDHLTDALEIYDRLLKACEEKLGSRHPQVAQLLISRELCRGKLKRFNVAPDDFPRALSILNEVLGDEHPITLFTMDGYLSHLNSAGRVREAEQVALQTIALHEKVDGADSPSVVFALRPLAAIQQRMGKQQEELDTLNRVISIQSRTLGETHFETLHAREVLAEALRRNGDHGAARRLLEQNVQYQLKDGDGRRLEAAKTLAMLADVSLEISDFDAAQSFAERAVEAAGEIVPHDVVAVAEACLNLGGVFVIREEYDKASQQFLAACQECRNGGRREKQLMAQGYELLSDVEFRRGRFSTAIEQSRSALQIRLELDGPKSVHVAGLHEQQGMAEYQMGNLEAAEEEYQSAIQIYTAAADIESDDLPRVWGYLAILAEQHEQWDQAIEWNQKALDHCRRRFGTEHPRVANALIYLATTHQMHYDWGKTAELHLESLQIRLKLYRNLISTLSETEALTFVRGLYESRDRLLKFYRIAATLPKSELEQQLLSIPEITDENLYGVVWTTKGIATRTVASRRISPTDSPAAHVAWDDLLAARRELAELALAGNATDRSDRNARLVELTESKELLERQLAAEATRFRVEDSTDSVSVAELIAALPADVAVVDFLHSTTPAQNIAGRQDAATNYYEAFVLRHPQSSSSNSVTWLHLGAGDPIDQAVLSWRQSGGNRGATISNNANASDWQTAGEHLRTMIWEKLFPQLEGIKTVIIVPDGSLARVPWAALPGIKPGTFLIEDFAIGTVDHPQRLLTLLREPPASGKQVVVVGGLDYDKRPTSVRTETSEPRLATNDATSRILTNTTERGVPTTVGQPLHWATLPGTAREAEKIARLASKQFEVRRLNTEEATENNLEYVLPACRYIHFATHGYFADPLLLSPLQADSKGIDNASSPSKTRTILPKLESRHPLLLSGLVLTGANIAPQRDPVSGRIDRDGILTGEEITQIDLGQTELITLSACETGLGVVADGEGVLGLQRAFAAAGARTVVASLWKVDDAATQELMTEFYKNLWERGLGKLESLRQAQLTLLKRYDVESQQLLSEPTERKPGSLNTPPFYWAAFSLSGDWR